MRVCSGARSTGPCATLTSTRSTPRIGSFAPAIRSASGCCAFHSADGSGGRRLVQRSHVMLATEQVLASHDAALGRQDAVEVSMHYAADAVLIVNGHACHGRREIAAMYARLIEDLPDAAWRTDVAVIHEDLAYVEWACTSALSRVDSGTDTFVVVDGLITRQ